MNLTLSIPITGGKPRDFGKSHILCLPVGRFTTKHNSILKAVVNATKKKKKTFYL